ncbi:DUF2997 domain-containing protein [Synechocystis sp. LEGE 06083]|uniref:DUF2997 domain-containing protein n=1 Tax=Synechocystis sp. LEGE 06083 TaxID=915336 RepID=UPI00187ED9F9|nr:DUF2997 domain-containing protein [Synechocystis sp. LEGE 06083]MBE9194423.1 DUF2997 domain-containing protein [Synechocystis sp. LEGE 06083]
MAEYQQVEYRIGKDGKVTERVINATGDSCTLTTSGVEKALGDVEDRELLPEYYDGDENLVNTTNQSLGQNL